ncbi:hypothetical protein BDB01DRAFT_806294 [Pilobolus umbonatus]|nr:hypothetical protein BDB01DRAFT_806294 [Pilobolus umbonatus]
MPERRDIVRRKERIKTDEPVKQPIILDRRTTGVKARKEKIDKMITSLPLYQSNKFNTESVLKKLSDHPGHFVIGIIGKQGVGKSTLLSHFTQQPDNAFSTQSCDDFLEEGHQTVGIDMYITPERAILLDTEPILCWTVLEKALDGSLDGLHPDLWLEMEAIYQILFLYSICNVVIVTTEGAEIDMNVLLLLQRAEMLKFNIPEFPLLTGHQETNVYPELVFVCNKCTRDEFEWRHYETLQSVLHSFFESSQLKTEGLISLSEVLLLFKRTHPVNLFFLPDQQDKSIESFEVLVHALRDQVLAIPRKTGRRGQVSEKDWFRNAIKIHELIHKSDYITEYLHMVKKLRD